MASIAYGKTPMPNMSLFMQLNEAAAGKLSSLPPNGSERFSPVTPIPACCLRPLSLPLV